METHPLSPEDILLGPGSRSVTAIGIRHRSATAQLQRPSNYGGGRADPLPRQPGQAGGAGGRGREADGPVNALDPASSQIPYWRSARGLTGAS